MAGLLILALLALIAGLILRFDPLVYLFYALVGVYLANRVWMARSLHALSARRVLSGAEAASSALTSDTSAFLGDRPVVTLHLRNSGILPVAWATVEERLPSTLRSVGAARWALALGPHEQRTLRYELFCARRGYYTIGPLLASAGTPWERERRELVLAPPTHLTVYPHIVPLHQLGLPSRLPVGARRSASPLQPDPSRLVGIRAYTPGDRLRDIHWPATARAGALQVKKYEPTKPLQAAIFLDLDAGAYDFRTRERASELAIVVAASIAAQVAELRQAVGLVTNGRDPLASEHAQPERSELTAPAAPEPAAPVPGLLPATEALTAAGSPPAAPAPRPVLTTDPTAPPTLPEETYDEEIGLFVDAAEISGAPAAPIVLPVHDGRAHLAGLMATLARIELRESPTEHGTPTDLTGAPLPFPRMVRRRAASLPWGTTIILITAAPTDELLPTMMHLRNSGYTPLAIFVQRPRLVTDLDASVLRAAGFPAYDIYDEGMIEQLQLDVRA